MKAAPKHPQEKARLEALQALRILDTLPEMDFDQITQLASLICETPIALISLVDSDRQWFKSKVGLSATETPRDLAFCAHAILQEDVFLVKDSWEDERFSDNPLATGAPHVRFYAGAPLISPEGLPLGTVCVIDHNPRNLTPEQTSALKALSHQVSRLLDLKLQIENLKTAEEKLLFKNTAVDCIIEGIVLQNQSGAIIDFNPAALKVLDLTADQLTGKTSMDPHWRAIREDGSDFPGQEHPAMVTLRTGKPQQDVIMGIHSSRDGIRWLNINSSPLLKKGEEIPNHVVTSFADITNMKNLESTRRTLEQNLAESARLSALGEMAGGIAHEINNPLAIIAGKTSRLKKLYDEKKLEPGEAEKAFQSIQSTVERIAKIIKGLKTISRNAENDPFEEVPASNIINDTLELCREKFKLSSIDLKTQCNSTTKIQCRSAQISQILMNLLENSYDAISNLPNPWINVRLEENGDYIKIIVQDSGSGIASHVAKKLMQPFFTTKPVGKGTGLGLSISKGIAEVHGGSLEYDASSPTTQFLLTLPKRQKSLQNPAA